MTKQVNGERTTRALTYKEASRNKFTPFVPDDSHPYYGGGEAPSSSAS
jgi:hypothetical protein